MARKMTILTRVKQQEGIMTLKEWIKQNGLSYNKAATKIGIKNKNPATNLQRYSTGQRIPHKKVMEKIYFATNKKVQPNDFYDFIK